MVSAKSAAFETCRSLFPEWANLSISDFDLDDPKGFSSFTIGIRSKACVQPIEPAAVLYRRLEGKENAILDFETEREVFQALGANNIAAHCYHYDRTCRIEAFYRGRTLRADDLFDRENLRKIAGQLYRLHQLKPPNLPQETFFEALFAKWGRLARTILEDRIDAFPPEERALCEDLRQIYSPKTLSKVRRCIPEGDLTFCHNDTYHGNIMKLDNAEIRLLDFEFSCLNNKAYDFSNLFAETVMRHQQPDYPYFRIAEPEFGDQELGMLIGAYLDHVEFASHGDRETEFQRLLQSTRDLLPLSDFKYAMAALPLAVQPIQKIRFIPYAHQRFTRFLSAYEQRFGRAETT